MTRKACTGSAMFFTFCSPIGSKPKASFFSTSLATFPETQMPPGLRQLLKPGRDIDALAIAVLALDDHLAEIDPDPDLDPLILGNGGVAFRQPALQRHGAFHGVHDAAEFGQQPVAHQLEDVAVVAGNLGLEQFLASGTKALERAGLVALHQGGIAHDIGSENGGKLAVHWFGLAPRDHRTGRT